MIKIAYWSWITMEWSQETDVIALDFLVCLKIKYVNLFYNNEFLEFILFWNDSQCKHHSVACRIVANN